MKFTAVVASVTLWLRNIVPVRWRSSQMHLRRDGAVGGPNAGETPSVRLGCEEPFRVRPRSTEYLALAIRFEGVGISPDAVGREYVGCVRVTP